MSDILIPAGFFFPFFSFCLQDIFSFFTFCQLGLFSIFRGLLCNILQRVNVGFWPQSCIVQVHFTNTRGKKEIHPYYISPIEMRSLWMEIKCVKSATRLLDRIWVNKEDLDLSKELLWASVGQRAAVLQAVKVGGQKKILPIAPVRTRIARAGLIGRIFFLTSNFDSL